MYSDSYGDTSKKVCSECGCEIQEQVESYVHLCERCMNKVHE
ncbi:protein YhfH [Aneurinibacillus terranovensis]|nr:protein YhfH [Aneurinibacillus terranovensis]